MPATHHHSSSPPTPGTTAAPDPGEKADQPQSPKARTAGTAKTTKPEKQEKTDKPEKSEKAEKSEKSGAAKSAPAEAPSATTIPPTSTPAKAAAPKAAAALPVPGDGPLIGRIPVLDVRPLVAGGRRPAKAVVGEAFEISATVFREGHDAVAANVVLRDPEGRTGPWTPMRELAPGTDRWGATVSVPRPGRWTYTVEAWGDPITTWRHHAQIKIPAGMDTELVLEEGALLYERAATGVPKSKGRRDAILAAVDALRDTDRPAAARLAAALTPDVDHVLARHPLRELVSSADQLTLLVERERALFGSWYEFFPRSEGAVVEPDKPPVSGTFRTAARRLPAIAEMGFDVVYLPPIHPIGTTFRKGPNNTLNASPYDVGVPWAIGSPEGGHDAVHPDLGTIEDFDAFVDTAAGLGLEVALDFALQCSPDH
uniref:maltotransferase domain-containing protein n=1 Tax=Streptomyces albicerus TaxID=2569859 RepID=UPI001CED6063